MALLERLLMRFRIGILFSGFLEVPRQYCSVNDYGKESEELGNWEIINSLLSYFPNSPRLATPLHPYIPTSLNSHAPMLLPIKMHRLIRTVLAPSWNSRASAAQSISYFQIDGLLVYT